MHPLFKQPRFGVPPKCVGLERTSGAAVAMTPDDARPDSALGLSGIPHTGEAVMADGHLVEPQAEDFRSARLAPRDPDWYKSAVFYEVLVRAFTDSNGDGTGDLRGL